MSDWKPFGNLTAEARPGDWKILAEAQHKRIERLEKDLSYALSNAEEALNADRHVERVMGRMEGAAEANPNAHWMTAAHILCSDYGVPHGLLTDRIAGLRREIEAKDVNYHTLAGVQIEENNKHRAAMRVAEFAAHVTREFDRVTEDDSLGHHEIWEAIQEAFAQRPANFPDKTLW
jgi:hypothetical protein